MAVSQEYLDYIMDQLRSFGPVRTRRMFGGAGLYLQDVFFGLIADDVLYLKVDDSNRNDYLSRDMGPFRPFGSYEMSYYEVPVDVLEDPDDLAQWAKKSMTIAASTKRPSRRSAVRGKKK